MINQKLSFVLRGSIRKRVILSLNHKKIPSQIKEETKLEDSNISRALKELERERIVKCLTPKQKTGRIYELTKIGEKVRGELEKQIFPNPN